MTKAQEKIISEGRRIKNEVAMQVLEFAKRGPIQGCSMVFHMTALAQEIALFLTSGDTSKAMDMMSDAVNRSQPESQNIYKLVTATAPLPKLKGKKKTNE